MEESHRTILRSNRGFIVKNLTGIGQVVDALQENEILTESMAQEILESESTNISRTRKLLDIVPKRGPLAFSAFCNVMIATGQRGIAERLDPSFIGRSGPLPVSPSPGGQQSVFPSPPSAPVPVQVPIPGTRQHEQCTGGNTSYQPAISRSGNQSSSGPGSLPSTKTGTQSHAGGEPYPSEPQSGTKQTPSPSSNNIPLGRHPSRDMTNQVSAPSDDTENEEEVFPSDWPASISRAPMDRTDFQMTKCDQTRPIVIDERKVYPMSKPERGRVLIINNNKFDEDDSTGVEVEERSYSNGDSTRLNMLFRSLNFRVVPKSNLSGKELHQVLVHESQQVDHSQSQCFVLVILSYGGKNTVICSDGTEAPISDIMSFFSEKKCKSLQDKPKLFFVQACGKKIKDQELEEDLTESIITSMDSLNLRRSRFAEYDETDTAPDAFSEVEMNNMFVAMATTPDFNDEHNQYNSTFMLAMDYVFCHCAYTDDLLAMMRKINRLKRDSNSGKYVQLCEWRSSLVRKLYLYPGFVEQPGSQLFGHTQPLPPS